MDGRTFFIFLILGFFLGGIFILLWPVIVVLFGLPFQLMSGFANS